MKNLLTILILMFTCSLHANNINYGLYFNSYSSLGKDRTSLVLNNNEPLDFNNETTISFDLFIRKEIVFGNVIRIFSNSGESITLNFSADEKNNRYPSLTVNESFYPVSNTIEFETWFPVSLKLSPQKDSLYLSYQNIQKSFLFDYNKWKNIRISLGVCTFPGFETGEVAPVNVKDIKIYEKSKLIRHWELREHNGDICYDRIKSVPAEAKNSRWIIDSHTNWLEIYSKKFENANNPQYAYDAKKDILYIVPDEKVIIVYDIVSKKESAIPVKGGYPAGMSTNGLIYDYLNDELVSYSLDEQTVSLFSFKNQKWSKNTPAKDETRFWHHTASINEVDSSLVTFGGYGYYKYKNDLFEFNLNKKTWERNKLLTITPRYSSASAIIDNKLYIFGGRGSETGKQEVKPQFNYDFYVVDLDSYEVKLIWEAKVETDFLPCGGMVFNTIDSCFYMLTSLEHGTLLRFNTKSPQITKVSTGINQTLDADFNLYTLFFSPQQKKIYALFSKNYKTGKSNIVFYEIDFPPLSYPEISQEVPAKANHLWGAYIGGIICLFGLLIVAIIFLAKKKIKMPKRREVLIDSDIEKTPVCSEEEKLADTGNAAAFKEKIFDRTKHCISLLGGFNVMDGTGKNITSNFTPILKHLLLLIILYSEEEKGINDKKIDNLLWSDKENKAARNNRNVSLTRLKLLLDSFGDISLINSNGFWKISFREDTFCDYLWAVHHIKEIDANREDKKTKSELLELLMYGPLLPYTQVDWLDKFKSNYSNDAINILYKWLLSEEVAANKELRLQIADAIFLFDSLNEEALGIKCTLLYNSGKKGLAKNTYDIFTKEYKTLLGEDYKYSFNQVLATTKGYEINNL